MDCKTSVNFKKYRTINFVDTIIDLKEHESVNFGEFWVLRGTNGIISVCGTLNSKDPRGYNSSTTFVTWGNDIVSWQKTNISDDSADGWVHYPPFVSINNTEIYYTAFRECEFLLDLEESERLPFNSRFFILIVSSVYFLCIISLQLIPKKVFGVL